MKNLDPKSRWLFFIRYLVWLFILILFVMFPFIVAALSDGYYYIFIVMLSWIIIVYAILLFISYIWAYFAYRFYKYELTDMVFKKEFGVIYKHYVSIPYARIQNIDINRGIWARILGLSDLHIQTAGMSGGGGSRWAALVEGRLPGLAKNEAERLREELMNKVNKTKGQGL